MDYIISNKKFVSAVGSGYKVAFIKAIRSTFNIGLKEAKAIADQFNMQRIEEYIVCDLTVYDSISAKELDTKLYNPEAIKVEQGTNSIKEELISMITQLLEVQQYSKAQTLLDALKQL